MKQTFTEVQCYNKLLLNKVKINKLHVHIKITVTISSYTSHEAYTSGGKDFVQYNYNAKSAT